MNYLKLAKSFGWVDSVNFLIISKEYEKIKEQLEHAENKVSEVTVAPPLYQTPDDEALAEPEKNIEDRAVVEQTQKVTFQKTIESQVSFVEKSIKQPNSDFSVSPRQKKILQILEEKGKAQVSDLKIVLADVTKRTIRRDLDELLKNEEVIRVGEWNQVFYELGHK